MTAQNDRRHRLQAWPVPVLNRAIDEIIYRPQDRQILRDMFLGDLELTYEAAAEKYDYSRSGMIKRVGRLTDRVEKYLDNKRVN